MDVDYNILLGTDFNDKILRKGLGPVYAKKLITKKETLNKTEFHKSQGDLIEQVRKIHLEPEINEVIPKFNDPEVDKLKELLVEIYNFNDTRVDMYIERLESTMDIILNTTSLDEWM